MVPSGFKWNPVPGEGWKGVKLVGLMLNVTLIKWQERTCGQAGKSGVLVASGEIGCKVGLKGLADGGDAQADFFC